VREPLIKKPQGLQAYVPSQLAPDDWMGNLSQALFEDRVKSYQL